MKLPKFLKKEGIPEITHQAFYQPENNGNWSVHYADGRDSSLMDKATAISYAHIFKAPYIFKARGWFRGMIIDIDSKDWV